MGKQVIGGMTLQWSDVSYIAKLCSALVTYRNETDTVIVRNFGKSDRKLEFLVG